MQDRQIYRYIKGEGTFIERKNVVEWIRESLDNQKKFNILKAKYIGSTLKDVENNDNEVHYKKLNNRIKGKRKYIYSSLIALVFLLGAFFLGNNNQEVVRKVYTNSPEINNYNDTLNTITSNSIEQEVILPDGSIITLNIDSKLIYPKKFNDTIREVTLIGEAFFDIKKDVNKPFIVNANELKIRVLGTSFNVKSYSEDNKIETTLVSGKVELIKDEETPIILAPSQKAVFNKTEKKMKIEEVNASDVIAWREGKLIFNKTTLQDVVIDLERKYHVQFIIKSKSLLDYEYTGTFDNLKINEVIDLLIISSPIKYTIQNDKIILNMK
tara:strand:+ start:889 stop:1866 length:978 start_codon:yes stop_codon:yes gene_type:complete